MKIQIFSNTDYSVNQVCQIEARTRKFLSLVVFCLFNSGLTRVSLMLNDFVWASLVNPGLSSMLNNVFEPNFAPRDVRVQNIQHVTGWEAQ
jgi:hypothetical protein